MGKYRFLEVASLQEPLADSSMFLPKVADIYDAFHRNMTLAVGLKVIPAYAGLAGREWAHSNIEAVPKVLSLRRNARNEQEIVQLSKSAWKRMNQRMSNIRRDGELRQELKYMTEVFETVVDHSVGYVGDLVHLMLTSMVVQSWTAIEVLVEDLLEKVMVEYPALFTRKKSYAYASRWKFRDTYDDAFLKDTRINVAIEDPSIDALCLLRNVIVHANAIADESFVKPANRLPTEGYPTNPLLQKWLPGLKEGDLIQINGEIAKEIMQPCLLQGRVLVSEVDAWLRPRI